MQYALFYSIYSVHFILYTLLGTLYSVHFIMYSLFFTIYYVLYILYTLLCNLYSLHFIMYSIFCTLYSENVIMYTFKLQNTFLCSQGFFRGFETCSFSYSWTPSFSSWCWLRMGRSQVKSWEIYSQNIPLHPPPPIYNFKLRFVQWQRER